MAVVLTEYQLLKPSVFHTNIINFKAMIFKKTLFSISLLFLALTIFYSCSTTSVEEEIGIENDTERPTYKTSKDELEER